MQTILGANGSIGSGIARELKKQTDNIRVVSRTPRAINSTDQAIAADLCNAAQVADAVKGSEVVYVTAGLVYNIDVWQSQWPVIIKNVIAACRQSGSKLVFFDNVYMYGKVNGWMTEETPINPVSKKGEVRAHLAAMIMDEVKAGNLQALIARAPDFYGPKGTLGFINFMLFDNYAKGKSGQWLVSDQYKHSLIYTPDAARATALLGSTPDAFGQLWHLPSQKNALTGKEFIHLAATAFGVKPDYMSLAKWMIKAYGMFDKNVKESVEMLYQYDSDYLFDSSKFDKRFAFKNTSYDEALKAIAGSYK